VHSAVVARASGCKTSNTDTEQDTKGDNTALHSLLLQDLSVAVKCEARQFGEGHIISVLSSTATGYSLWVINRLG